MLSESLETISTLLKGRETIVEDTTKRQLEYLLKITDSLIELTKLTLEREAYIQEFNNFTVTDPNFSFVTEDYNILFNILKES